MIDRIETCNHSQQDLRRTDVASPFLSPNMLLLGLQREPQRQPDRLIHGHPDNATRHSTTKSITHGHDHGARCVPWGFEAYGLIGVGVQIFLKELVTAGVRSGSIPRHQQDLYKRRWRAKLSCALARGVATAVRTGAQRRAASSSHERVAAASGLAKTGGVGQERTGKL